MKEAAFIEALDGIARRVLRQTEQVAFIRTVGSDILAFEQLSERLRHLGVRVIFGTGTPTAIGEHGEATRSLGMISRAMVMNGQMLFFCEGTDDEHQRLAGLQAADGIRWILGSVIGHLPRGTRLIVGRDHRRSIGAFGGGPALRRWAGDWSIDPTSRDRPWDDGGTVFDGEPLDILLSFQHPTGALSDRMRLDALPPTDRDLVVRGRERVSEILGRTGAGLSVSGESQWYDDVTVNVSRTGQKEAGEVRALLMPDGATTVGFTCLVVDLDTLAVTGYDQRGVPLPTVNPHPRWWT